MLNPRFKNLHLVLCFICREQGYLAIVREYDEIFLYLMLLKCFHHLRPVVRYESEFVE
jgi:hypothetical protein